MNKDRKIKGLISKYSYYIVLISFIVPIFFLIYRIATWDANNTSLGIHSREDYLLMLVQCILGVIVIHVPSFLTKKLKFELPVLLYVMYVIFLYCAIFLGEIRSFYYTVPHWDDFLHLFSSMMTGLLAALFVTILNKDDKLVFQLSPFFVALFAFAFSMAIGAIWEIYEFVGDGILGLNMQRYITVDGEILIGHEALVDTMKDIIVDLIGALIASTICYLSIKFNKGWIVPTLTEDKKD